MEKNTENQIIYQPFQNYNYERYGFIKVDGGIIFSKYFLKIKNDIWDKFVNKYFRDIANCYYFAMRNDVKLPRNRKRRLFSFLRSIWEQEDVYASILMVKAINVFDNNDEYEVINKVIKVVLPNAGYFKEECNNRYVWKFDVNKKFSLGLGKVFILVYINNNFDKDLTWRYIKKHCYLKNGTWQYKNFVTQKKIETVLTEYLKNGGIIVEEMTNTFEAFVPFSAINNDGKGSGIFVSKDTILNKGKGDGKSIYVQGTASTTDIDFDSERVSKNFIKKMKAQAVGLPLKVNGHYSSQLDDTVGVVIDKGGNEDEFNLEGKLQPPDHNKNVEKLIQKMDDGINFGFSIFGKVTRAFREIDARLKKEILVLDDGELSHVLITDQPANKATFAECIIKSVNKNKNDIKNTSTTIQNKYKHNSSLIKNEPKTDDVKVDELPEQAFPINFKDGTIEKKYPHHFLHEANLYLHKMMTIQSYMIAKKNGASAFVINHLQSHLQIIGLQKEIDNLMELKDEIEKSDIFSEEMEAILNEVAKEAKPILKMRLAMKDKMSKLDAIISKVAPKLTAILNSEEETV